MALPPKFFIPHTIDPVLAERTYMQIKANAKRDHGWKIAPDRILAIDHTENDKRLHSEVGKPDPENGETVIAIFSTLGGPFLVCTPSRVWFQGQRCCLPPASVTLFET
jgi:hypothetical protein